MTGFWRRFARQPQGSAHEPEPARPEEVRLPAPLTRRVLMVTHAPVLRTRGPARTLAVHFGWQDPETLAQAYIADVRWCSYGYANYEIAERITVDGFPPKADGFVYDERSYLQAWQTRRFHQPDMVDYLRLVAEFRVLERVAAGTIDEVWLFGFPYGGYYESIMAGPGAFWCNAPPLDGTAASGRRFVMMGFSYERGVGEMLENLGHRAESILTKVFAATPGAANLFERFTRYERTHPGQAECGNVHFAPNSRADYDWGNPQPVLSRCANWEHFPDLSGPPRTVDCREWGSGDIRAHHRWWLRHFPHVEGAGHGISWNWWTYVLDPQQVRV